MTPRDELTPKDVLEEYLAERDAVQFSINAGIPPDKWEREFQRTHDALALALARIEALEDDVCLLEHALRDAVENKPCWDLMAKAMLQPINRMLDRMRRAGATPEEAKAAFVAAPRGEEER
jgi:hypothetical protein